MPKKTINAKEILADIKGGMDDSALMEKYQLSEKGLQSLFKKLVDAGVLKQREQDERPSEPEESGKYVWKCSQCGKSQPKPFDQCPECGKIGSRIKTQLSEQVEEIKGQESEEKSHPSDINGLKEAQERIHGASSGTLDRFKTILRKPYVATIAGAMIMGLILVVFFGVQKHNEQSVQGKAVTPNPLKGEPAKVSEADGPLKKNRITLDEQLIYCAMHSSLENIPVLLGKGANINAKDPSTGMTPLMLAVEKDDIETAILLLHYGADVNVRDRWGMSASIIANARGNRYMTSLLAEKGATFTSTDREKAFRHACYEGNVGVVTDFLNQGVDINAGEKGDPPGLLEAAGAGHEKTVGLLLARGANVNVRNHDTGATALMHASSKGHLQVVELLVRHGADVDAKANNGVTALDVAASQGNVQIMEFLKARGAKE